MSVELTVRGLAIAVSPRGERNTRTVVGGVDLHVEPGSVCCVVGESGSGKTILLRSLLGISPARPGIVAGEALARSARLGELDLRRRRPPPGLFGYVFQHPVESLDPFRSVGSQVAESVAVAQPRLGRAARLARAIGWLDAVRLPDPASLARLHPHELSGGMAQRVAIAVALATEPELLVADEPTTGLDWSARRDVVELLQSLCASRGMTLILISHDFQVVRHVADRVVVLVGGELVEAGPRAAFFAPGPGRHPYSRLLQERVRQLEAGELPEPLPELEIGVGCVHAGRCGLRAAGGSFASRCAQERPPLVSLGADHRARCWPEALEASA